MKTWSRDKTTHTILVAFNIQGETRQEAMEELAQELPVVDGVSAIECWWIAEDDRIDNSDEDSAVFVPKGKQIEAIFRLDN